MTILERLDADIKEAMKAGEKEKLTVLRGLKSDIKYKQIDSDQLSDSDVIAVLSTAAKKRRESIDQFASAGRSDLADKEKSELEIIAAYLPKQLDEADLRRIITESVAESGASGVADLGKLMKVLMPIIKGQADGKLVNRLASEILAK